MGAPLTEFVIETVIRDGLGELKANPAKIDDIFSKFLQAQFNNQYGQAKIDSIKTYITNNQVKIVQGLAQIPFQAPCISIQLTRADEEERLQNLGNNYPEDERPTTPVIYADPVTPGTFDLLTEKLTITNVVDLSPVCAGMIFVDKIGTKFEIKSPISNMAGDKYITLVSNGNTPDLSGDGRIESSIDFIRSDIRMIRLRESISLGVHAKNDLHLGKFLYYILVYILKSRQESLIARGIELDRGTGNVFDREQSYEGENIFSRFLEVTCITEFTWNQGDVQVFDCFHLEVKTNTPNPDSPDAAPYNTSG